MSNQQEEFTPMTDEQNCTDEVVDLSRPDLVFNYVTDQYQIVANTAIIAPLPTPLTLSTPEVAEEAPPESEFTGQNTRNEASQRKSTQNERNDYSRAVNQRNRNQSTNQESDDTIIDLGTLYSKNICNQFCDLCERYFTNKYYLARHKADAHKVYSRYVPRPVNLTDDARQAQSAQYPTNQTTQNGAFNSNVSAPLDSSRTSNDQASSVTAHPILNLAPQLSGHEIAAELATIAFTMRLALDALTSLFPVFADFNQPLGALVKQPRPCVEQQPREPAATISNIGGGDNSGETNFQSTSAGAESPPQREMALCALCDAEMCDTYFLRLHYMNVHKFCEEYAKKLAENKSLTAWTTVPTESSDAKPKSRSLAQIRVPCPSCGKELCNKYFLRTHLINTHKMTEVQSADIVSKIIPNKYRPSSTIDSQNQPETIPTAGNDQSQLPSNISLTTTSINAITPASTSQATQTPPQVNNMSCSDEPEAEVARIEPNNENEEEQHRPPPEDPSRT